MYIPPNYVPSPGFSTCDPSDSRLVRGEDGLVGVVLEVFESTNEAFFPGPRCSVLLVDTLQVVGDVIIPQGPGGSATNVNIVTPTPTSQEIMEEIWDAVQGNGCIPCPSSANSGWGSWVSLDRIGGGQLIIGQYLYHPGIQAKRLPVVGTGTSPLDQATAAALRNLRANEDELPETLIDSASIPVSSPPLSYQSPADVKQAWVEAYRSGWTAGAEAGYYLSSALTSESGAELFDGLYAAAQADGWRAGWTDGELAGLAERTKTPPPTAVAAIPVAVPSTPVADAGDTDGDGAYAALPTGRDRFIEHCGNRIVLFENGGIRVDTRASGPIELQGGDGGTRLTAGGAIIDVGNGGKSVTVTADTITLGGNTDRVILGDKFIREYLDHTHLGNGAETGKPTQQFAMADMLSDGVHVA
jgi:hypothetical protein